MTRNLAESLGGGLPVDWARDFLIAVRLPVTEENLRAVVSWEIAESGGGGGMWNPLNTTQGGYPGETDANGVGVKNYRTRADGLAANAKVINNGLYKGVVAAFGRGDSALAVINEIIRSPWGTRRIALVAPLRPTPVPKPQPPKGRAVQSFPSKGKAALEFRGARVDPDAGTIELLGGAVLDPPEHPNKAAPWGGVYPRVDGQQGFVIWSRGDLDEYHYLLT